MLYAGVLFYLTLEYLRPQEFLPFIQGLPIVFFTMAALLPPWLVTLQNRKILRTPEDLFIFLLWVAGCLSWINYYKSHIFDPAWEFGKTLLSYLFVAHVVDTRRRLAGTLWVTMLMLLGITLLGGQNVGLPGQYASIGMFDNRNDFAYGITMMLPISVAFILLGDPFAKVVGAGACLAGLVQLAETGSRGGMLAAFFSIYAVFYTLVRSKGGRRVMFILGAGALLVVFMFSERLASVQEYQKDQSSMGRVEIWARALEVFKEHWLFGCGWNTWDDQPKTPRDTHNSYVRAFAELGIVGAFAYVGLFFFGIRTAYSIARDPPNRTIRVIAFGLTGLLVGQAVAGLFQTRTYHVFVLVQFALVSALRLIAREERRANEGTATAPAGPAAAEPPSLTGFGFAERRLITGKDFRNAVVFTAMCWLMHKLFIMLSF